MKRFNRRGGSAGSTAANDTELIFRVENHEAGRAASVNATCRWHVNKWIRNACARVADTRCAPVCARKWPIKGQRGGGGKSKSSKRMHRISLQPPIGFRYRRNPRLTLPSIFSSEFFPSIFNWIIEYLMNFTFLTIRRRSSRESSSIRGEKGEKEEFEYRWYKKTGRKRSEKMRDKWTEGEREKKNGDRSGGRREGSVMATVLHRINRSTEWSWSHLSPRRRPASSPFDPSNVIRPLTIAAEIVALRVRRKQTDRSQVLALASSIPTRSPWIKVNRVSVNNKSRCINRITIVIIRLEATLDYFLLS